MALERDTLDTERDTLESPAPPPVKMGDAATFAYATLAVHGLPTSSFDKIVNSYYANGGDQQGLEEYVSAYSNRLDETAGSYLINKFVQESQYNVNGIDKFDPSAPAFKTNLREITTKLFEAQNEALPRLVIEKLAQREAGIYATPEEEEQLRINAADPKSVIDGWDASRLSDWEAITNEWNKQYGATNSIGEQLGTGLVSVLVIPDIVSSWALSSALGLDMPTNQRISVASVYKKARDKYFSIPTQEGKDQYFRDVVKATHESPWFTTDFQASHAINMIVGPEGMQDATSSDNNRVGFIADAIFQAVNAAPVVAGGLGRTSGMMRGGLKSLRVPPSAAQVGEANPAVLQDLLRQGLQAPKGTPSAMAVGTPVEIAAAHFPEYTGGMTAAELDAVKPGLGSAIEAIDSNDRRLGEIISKIEDTAATAAGRTLTPEARVSAAQVEKNYLENELAGVVRMGESTVATDMEVLTRPDLNGLIARVSIGRTLINGLRKANAIEIAKRVQSKGLSARIYSRAKDGTRTYVPIDNLEIANVPEPTSLPLGGGKFFVEVEHQYSYSPKDMAAYGGEVVNGFKWAGQYANALSAGPSAWLRNMIRYPFTANTGAEKALVDFMERVIKPVRDLPNAYQHTINRVLIYNEDFARRVGRPSNMRDWAKKFGDQLTPAIINGIYTMRRYFDAAYKLANRRVYNALGGEHGRSIVNRTTGKGYHGVPVRENDIGTIRGDILNPQTGKMIKLGNEQLKAFYAKGGVVLRSPLEEQVGNRFTDYVLHSGEYTPDWAVQPLSHNPLQYIPDYRPRITRDNVIIEKITKGGTKNGRTFDHHQAVYAVGSIKEAQRLIKALNAKKGKGTWAIKSTVGSDLMDKTLQELQRFRMDGLIYADRGVPLLSAEGLPAEILDPINAMEVQMRLLARSIALEDLVKFHLEGWAKTFKDVVSSIAKIENGKDITKLPYEEAVQLLKAHFRDVPNAKEAFLSYRYLYSMRGMLDESPAKIRELMMAVADTFYNLMQERGGGILGGWSKETKGVLARTGRDYLEGADPLRFVRKLAYWNYLKLNPLKQRILQASQPLFILPLVIGKGINPYKWWRSSADLLQLSHLDQIEEVGGKVVAKKLLDQIAKDWGRSTTEIKLLVNEFEKSGIAQGTNLKAFAGEYTRTATRLPETKAGDVLQKAGTPFRSASHALDRHGSVRGELTNVTMSWKASFDDFMVEHPKIKNWKEITRDQWTEIDARAYDYAGGMNKANRSAWQNNDFLSTVMQFFNFTHKALSTMFFMNKNAFTAKQSATLLASNLIGFGFHGIPLLPIAAPLMENWGIDKKYVDIVNWGLWDIVTNGFVNLNIAAYNKLTDSQVPESEFHVAQFFAPGANVFNMSAAIYNKVAEGIPYEWLMGPSGKTVMGFWKSIKLAHDIVHYAPNHRWDDTKWLHAGEVLLSGLSSGVSHVRLARLAQEYGRQSSERGKLSGLSVTTLEAVGMGLLGIRPKGEESYYDVIDRVAGGGSPPSNDSIRQDAQEAYDRIRRVLVAVGQGVSRIDEADMIAQENQLIYQDQDPAYSFKFREALLDISRNYEPIGEDIGSLVDKAHKNIVIDQHIVNTVMESKDVPTETKQRILQLFEDQKSRLPQALEWGQEADDIEKQLRDNLKRSDNATTE